MNVLLRVGLVMCASLLIATSANAEILGTEPGTSSNPQDNVPKKIQRSTLGEASYPKGSSGAGTRGDELVGMEKEKAEPVTLDDFKKNVEKTHGGASAVAAEKLIEKSRQGANHKEMAHQGGKSAAGSSAHEEINKQARTSQKLHSDKTVQGQDLVNEQPMDKQQPANRTAVERGH